MRKILIGFVSLGVVAGVYLLYGRISDTPDIDTDRGAEVIESATDGNAVGLDGEMGRIGDVGLGPVDKAHYVTRDPKTQEIVRETGFEKLLHAVRDVWEIEKPYMNVYRRNFKFYLTADKGEVQVETAVGKTTPKDATFSSNVVIHIVPTGSSGIKESFVYLDDIIFLSERSLLSTAGPVRFESEDAQMHGKGLELIYNEQAERLEYFRIADLESMRYRVKDSQAALFSSTQTSAEAPAGPEAQAETREPNETTVAGAAGEQEALPTEAQPSVESPTLQSDGDGAQEQGEYYKCVLSDNVLIDTPGQLIFADEKLDINDIFWSKAFVDQSDEAEAGVSDTTETAGPTARQNPQTAESVAEPNIPVSEPSEPNESLEPPAFIVITCDGGLTIVPRDSTRIPDEPTETGVDAAALDNERREQRAVAIAAKARRRLDGGTERTKFFARSIDYNTVTGDVIAGGLSELTYYRTDATTAEANEPRAVALAAKARRRPTPVKVTARQGARYFKTSNQVVFSDCLCTMRQGGLTEQRDVTFLAPEITVDLPEVKSKQPDILAAGPTELAFYMEDANRPTTEGELVPVTVSARKRARYLAALNQMAFEGDCRCTMLREDPNVVEEYVLLSERMTVDLAEDANDRTPGPAAGVEHLTATGEVVRLATTRTAKAGGAFAEAVADANGTGRPRSKAAATERLLGGIELKCRQFDYDAVQQLYWATGPGIIRLNNAVPADPNEQAGPLSLREPCWAIIGGFDALRYSLRANRILADAGPQEKLWIEYTSIVDGEDYHDVTATASHVEAFLHETGDGQMELSTLNATGGILYEDDRNHQFIGSELFYDHTTAILKVRGDAVQPCYYNGILVDKIRYDVNADRVKSNVVGPGTIRLRGP